MTLIEEYEQRHKDADKFYNRMDELEESIKEFIKHIDKIANSRYRSRAEVLSAVKKLSFELDGAIEEAEEYKKTTSNLLLLPTRRTLSSSMSQLISESLTATLRVVSSILGNIETQCYLNPKELEKYAESLDSNRDPLLETLYNQITLMQSVIGSLTIEYAKMSDKQIKQIFDQQLKRYEEEEFETIDCFIDNIIDVKSGKDDLREQYKDDKAVMYYQRKSNPTQFIKSLRNSESDDDEEDEHVFIEVELISVLDYISKNRRLKHIVEEEKLRKEEDSNDSLIRFVLDDKEREKVRKGLQNCQDTGHVASFAKLLWEEEILRFEVLRSGDFHRAILPLLSFETTEGAIKQAIIKQVK